MKYLFICISLGTILLIPHAGFAQTFQIEASLTRQTLDVTWSPLFESDNILYPAFYFGYNITQNHQIGLSFTVFSGKSSTFGEGQEAPTILNIKSYPIGLEYRYVLLADRALRPYLKSSFLIIPIKDTYESDVMPVHQNTTTWGVNLGGGLEWKMLRHFGIFAAINYRLVHQDDDRFNYMELKGLHIQAGLTAYF